MTEPPNEIVLGSECRDAVAKMRELMQIQNLALAIYAGKNESGAFESLAGIVKDTNAAHAGSNPPIPNRVIAVHSPNADCVQAVAGPISGNFPWLISITIGDRVSSVIQGRNALRSSFHVAAVLAALEN